MTEPRLRISVLIASRNNAYNLRTILGALDMLASGRHDIKYVVACDWDDAQTQALVNLDIAMSSKRRRDCLGTAWNDAALRCPADVYALVTDRALCVTPNWDDYIADAFHKDDTRITWWTTNAGPVIPIVPNKWMEAAGGKIYTDYFPFWFDDTWLHELSAFVHGLPSYLIQASCYIIKRSPTTKRMRDLRFWMDFFIAKRPERIAHAAQICAMLNLPEPDMAPIEEWLRNNDALWDKHWQEWESFAGDSDEPDEGYLEAKKSAEEFMNAVRA